MQPTADDLTPTPDDAAVRARLSEMLFGFMRTQALSAAAKLGIADIVDGEPRDVGDIARQVGAGEASLYRLLRFLASEGCSKKWSRDGSFPVACPRGCGVPGRSRCV